MGGRDQLDIGQHHIILPQNNTTLSTINICDATQAGNLTLRTLGLAGATVLSAELLGKVEPEVASVRS